MNVLNIRNTIILFAFFICLPSQASLITARLGIQNFREIPASLEVVTGVSMNQKNIKDLYKLTKDRLPTDGYVEEMSSTAVLGVTELGGLFCRQSVDNASTKQPGERYLFNSVSFKEGPSQFTSFYRDLLLQSLAENFWLRKANDKEMMALRNLFEGTVADAGNTVNDTKQVLHVLCTAYASSLQFLVKY